MILEEKAETEGEEPTPSSIDDDDADQRSNANFLSEKGRSSNNNNNNTDDDDAGLTIAPFAAAPRSVEVDVDRADGATMPCWDRRTPPRQ